MDLQPDTAARAEESDDRSARSRRSLFGVLALIVLAIVVLWFLWTRLPKVPDVTGPTRSAASVPATSDGRLSLPPATAPASEEPATVIVPDVSGLTSAAARSALLAVGLGMSAGWLTSALPAGQVIDQAPAAATVVSPGTTVDVVLSAGPSSGGSGGPYVPSVQGMTLAEAQHTLRAAGYAADPRQGPSTTVPSGLVYYQDPAPDSAAARGVAVRVWVSTGPPPSGYPYPAPTD